MSSTAVRRRRDCRSAQSGSAYLVALLALIVLTVIGLGLSLMTQTEMLIGGAERSTQRVFYAADSGLALATSRALENDFEGRTETLRDPGTPAYLNIRHVVETAPVQQINQIYCDLCNINRATEHGGDVYYDIYYAASAEAERVAGPTAVSLASMSVGVIVEMQPRKSTIAGLEAITDASAMAKVRF